jgi:CBS domain-containing protein
VDLKQERSMRARDVMSTKVLTIGLHEPLARARAEMDLRRVHHLVVVDGGRVMGVVTPELVAWGEAEGIARVEDVMFRHVVSGTPNMTIRAIANLMRGRTIGALPIFENERLVGIVTISDLLDLLGLGAERPVPSSRRWTPAGSHQAAWRGSCERSREMTAGRIRTSSEEPELPSEEAD